HIRIPLNLATVPPLTILLLLCGTVVSLSDVRNGIVGDESGKIVPFSILILVFSLATLCIYIDETGLFRNIAFVVTKRGGSDTRKLFRNLFLLSVVLTILTSNDVVVLTVTPILVYFAKSAKINAVPFLTSGFWVCNVASMGLYIGNPTNVIVAQANSISVLEYTKIMGLPTIFCVFLTYGMSLLIFWKDIPARIEPPELDENEYRIEDRFGAWFGSVALGTCLVLLMTVPLFVENLSVWILTLPFAVIVLVKSVISDLCGTNSQETQSTTRHVPPEPKPNDADSAQEPQNQSHLLLIEEPPSPPQTTLSKIRSIPSQLPHTSAILSRIPYPLIPFTLGMFILVESLTTLNWTPLLATCLSYMCPSSIATFFAIATTTTLACNLLNNLPMTILFTRALLHPNFMAGLLRHSQNDLVAAQSIQKDALFALVVGSNLGGNVLFVGSLAGIMWIDLVRRNGVEGVTQARFFMACLMVTPVVLAGACAILYAERAAGLF
ncbi:hypothetical protein HDU98_003782, partial [Podochytrium sp. JEL0797]